MGRTPSDTPHDDDDDTSGTAQSPPTAGDAARSDAEDESTGTTGQERSATTPAPDAPGELTERQRAILEMIHAHVDEHGYPPSVREIGDAVGLRSPSSVHGQLESLERKGYLRRDPTKPRALELGRDPITALDLPRSPARHVPLVGEIAAGGPILAEERVDAVYPLPKELVGDGQLFMLRVRGESMVEAGVFDGDLVVVREQPTVEQGEMCAALIEGEATVKFFRRTKSGEVFLDPANGSYEPIPVTASDVARIMGKVVTVLRQIR
ncbi:MAG: transcriptional repressor LexA [Nitriliruptor sp.]|nr:MAG: transcriptional repressor LexA [Nitriliruptor sp.]